MRGGPRGAKSKQEMGRRALGWEPKSLQTIGLVVCGCYTPCKHTHKPWDYSLTAYLWNKSIPNNPSWTHNHSSLAYMGRFFRRGLHLLLYFPWPPRPQQPTEDPKPQSLTPLESAPPASCCPRAPTYPQDTLAQFLTQANSQQAHCLPSRPLVLNFSFSLSQTCPDALSPCLLSACPTLPTCSMTFNKGPEGDVRGDYGRLCEEKPTAWQGPCA